MSSTELVDRARVHLLERRGALWLLLSTIAVSSYVSGYFLADFLRNTLAEEMKDLELEHQAKNEQAGEMLFLDQKYLDQVQRLARKLHADSQAWSSLVSSSTESPVGLREPDSIPPTPQIRRLLGLQTNSYQSRSQEVVAGTHSLCALQGIQHGPHGGSVGCQLSSKEGRWVLKAQKAQCSLICLN